MRYSIGAILRLTAYVAMSFGILTLTFTGSFVRLVLMLVALLAIGSIWVYVEVRRWRREN